MMTVEEMQKRIDELTAALVKIRNQRYRDPAQLEPYGAWRKCIKIAAAALEVDAQHRLKGA